MASLVAIDIGNTNIAIGMFDGQRLREKVKIPTDRKGLLRQKLAERIRKGRYARAIISSVVPAATGHVEHILYRCGIKDIAVLGKNARVPIENLYTKKREVGQDRLVNAYAAKTLYGSPAVIIDFGTAVTFDAVSVKGAYLGGLILPGIGISFSALYEKAALLPRVALERASSIIGRDTKDSMRGGILFGYGAMCDGLVARYKKMLGRTTNVIITGGDARLVSQYSKRSYIIDEDLTLKGLYRIGKRMGNDK